MLKPQYLINETFFLDFYLIWQSSDLKWCCITGFWFFLELVSVICNDNFFLFGFVFRSFEMKKILGFQYFLLLLIIWISASNSNQICVSNQTVSFVNQFLNIHGNGSQISKQTLEKIFTDFTGQKNFYDECQKSVDKSCAINKVRCPNVHS